jgi:Uma2 family endonuclease
MVRMAQLRLPQTGAIPPEMRYVRAPAPIHFPEEAEVPEGKTHLILRTFLFGLLRYALGGDHSVGSDQFVYWNASAPVRCVAPDLFVKLGVKDTSFGTWKTWERGGSPELAVEIVSPSEGDGVPWNEKLSRYHELGVKELVRFDPEGAEGSRLRVWDRVHDDLVERQIPGDRSPCLTLGLNWTVCPVDGEPVGLRLADDEGRLLETREEAAEARVRELEEKLARRG